jgi:hypothetical protein
VASQVDKSFRMCRHEEMKEFANLLQDVPLTLADRFTFCQAPVNFKKEEVARAVHKVVAQPPPPHRHTHWYTHPCLSVPPPSLPRVMCLAHSSVPLTLCRCLPQVSPPPPQLPQSLSLFGMSFCSPMTSSPPPLIARAH